MTCKITRLGGAEAGSAGAVVIVCSRGARPSKARCSVPDCPHPATKLCDYPLRGRKAGKTCDRKLCEQHATTMGPDRDYCPAHAVAGEPPPEPPPRAPEPEQGSLPGVS